MPDAVPIEIRPARWRDTSRAADFLAAALLLAQVAEAGIQALLAHPRNHVLALAGGRIVGVCPILPGYGRCAVVLPPRLLEWDEDLAARLCRAAAALARRRGARLIQMLTEPAGSDPFAALLARAGFEQLALLAYMRRPVGLQDRLLAPRPDLAWPHYTLLRRKKFLETIAETYVDSLDCPRLTGLRTIAATIATHRRTGLFSPRSWRLAVEAGRPVGVSLVNNLLGRGELVYLGVVPAARGRGIGGALLAQAIRDTAAMNLPQMGLVVDVANAPALRLYAAAGFKEIRRRLAWFIPKEGLDALANEC